MKKQYINFDDINCIKFENSWIPKNPSNRHYQQFLEEQKREEAELIPYTPPAPTWEQIRAQRDSLLKETDWIGVSDAQPKPNKDAWLNYRQALRDITKIFSQPEDVVWPTKP
jgi:hypothetical protein